MNLKSWQTKKLGWFVGKNKIETQTLDDEKHGRDGKGLASCTKTSNLVKLKKRKLTLKKVGWKPVVARDLTMMERKWTDRGEKRIKNGRATTTNDFWFRMMKRVKVHFWRAKVFRMVVLFWPNEWVHWTAECIERKREREREKRRERTKEREREKSEGLASCNVRRLSCARARFGLSSFGFKRTLYARQLYKWQS